MLVIIEKKLPKWIVEKLITLEIEKPNLKLEEVFACMRNSLHIKEMTEQVSPSETGNYIRRDTFPSTNSPHNFTKQCLFCESTNHITSFCTKFSDNKACIEQLKKLRRCLKCLKERQTCAQTR